MASDLRVLDAPLGKAACVDCGLIARLTPLPAALFASGYTLYAHPPGDARELARQRLYADWIAQQVDAPPRAVLDVGCGNGSLLLALGALWPDTLLLGCDPSREAVGHGRAAGLELWAGTLDSRDVSADLVVSVNVIEHATDAVAFLETVASRLQTDGSAVIVTPDATHPGVELLIADHQVSMTPDHLRAVMARAGFEVLRQTGAPPALGAFQMAVGSRTIRTPRTSRTLRTDRTSPTSSTSPASRQYLERWAALDAYLGEQTGGAALVCFGAGEAAGLLRAYAPQTWRRVRACAVDSAIPGSWFGDRPVVSLDDVASSESIVLGVRPEDQPAVAARLRAAGRPVAAWYDVV